MANERVEAEFTVPASTTVSASNSGGGATTVTLTPGDTFITTLCSDFAAALASQRAPSLGSWTVSLGTTGLVAIGCDNSTVAVPSFSLDWTSTALRDTFGFEYNINYPMTATEVARQIGYGDWSGGAGYLCNEASGNLSAVFGAPATLTAAGTPTYGATGPRGGADKAAGLDSAADAFSGGNTLDVGASDDLIVAWVARCTSTPVANSTMFSKIAAGAASGWAIFTPGGTSISIGGSSSSASVATNFMVNEWHVGIAVIERATGKMRIGIKSLTSGTTAISTEGNTQASYSTAASLIMGASAWTSQATYMDVGAWYITKGSGVATGLSTNLSTALSNWAAAFSTWTGTQVAAGVWYPGCNLVADSDPLQAPTGDDKAANIAPTGRVYSLSATEYFRQRNVRFPYVAQHRVWSNSATVNGEDWETFYLETQLGHHSWFEVGSRVRVYWDNAGTATEVGSGDVDAWYMPYCTKLDDLRMPVGGWTGLFEISLGDLFTDQ